MRWLLVLMLCLPPAGFAAEFPPVLPGVPLSLPQDHGAHPAYRTEWWYVTGWLRDDGGRERGFQITFFRVRTGIGEAADGRFSPAQLVFAHAAIADPATGQLRHDQRSARASGRLAGSATGRLEVWLGEWALRADGEDFVATAASEGFALDLRLTSRADPMANGDGGYSQKGPEARHASYYYSVPALAVSGEIQLDGTRVAVTGEAWMDHEWSSELMPEAAVGWDWIGINLTDGGAAMAFRMRDADGRAVWAGGTLRDPDGRRRVLAPDAVEFIPRRRWRSPRSGSEYVVEWDVRLGDRTLHLTPLMDDQELDARASTGAIYWEGAVRARSDGTAVGRGYLEMTGYTERLRM